jgi:hypothetical protein
LGFGLKPTATVTGRVMKMCGGEYHPMLQSLICAWEPCYKRRFGDEEVRMEGFYGNSTAMKLRMELDATAVMGFDPTGKRRIDDNGAVLAPLKQLLIPHTLILPIEELLDLLWVQLAFPRSQRRGNNRCRTTRRVRSM